MKTETTKHGVEYKVLDDKGRVLWSKFVAFVRGRPSGGPEFRTAARQQEQFALKFCGHEDALGSDRV